MDGAKISTIHCCLHEYDTNKILKDEIITKEDDPFTQRHENFGTEKIYA